MPPKGIRMYGFTHLFTALFVGAFLLSPLIVALVQSRRADVPHGEWVVATVGVAALMLLFAYVRRRCASDGLSYWRGLLVVTHSMRTGWIYSSMLMIFPTLLATFLMSVTYALWADLRGHPEEAGARFRAWVTAVHAYRMRQ